MKEEWVQVFLLGIIMKKTVNAILLCAYVVII